MSDKVYLVEGSDLHNDPWNDVYAVFATREEAEAWIAEKGQPHFNVSEWTIGHDLGCEVRQVRLSRPTPTETVNHLEVLHRVCERKGWKVLLRSESVFDQRDLSRLCTLAVVNRDAAELGSVDLDRLSPFAAAEVLLERLQKGGLVP